ncbi:MAG: hypothetical protein KAX37_10155 [Opitutaceae bacterium]|nr:hypothetical protein [Opitutaceae bacterium]
MTLRFPSRTTSLLGLVFDQTGIHAALASRLGDQIETHPVNPLPLDFRTGDPIALGTLLAGHLDKAGIKEKRCIIALPTEWFMTVSTALPELPAADSESLLQIEAEGGFPCESDELHTVRSPLSLGNKTVMTQLAVRTSDLARMTDLLASAGLRPLRYTVQSAVLPEALGTPDNGVLSLLLSETPPSLIVGAGSGIAALRSLPSMLDEPAALARDVRISFEENLAPVKSSLRRIRVLGALHDCHAVESSLAAWSSALAISLESLEWTPARSAAALAVMGLQQITTLPNFLPPTPSRWEQWTRRYNARRLRVGVFLCAAALIAIIGAFSWREYEAWQLRDQWMRIKPQVDDLEGVQARIREFRPWHDTSYRTLNVLRLVTDVFPENGTVTAKSFEIRNQSAVTVTGVTRDNTALLSSLDKLRQRPEVNSLKVEQIRGKSPAQFTFTFHIARTPES